MVQAALASCTFLITVQDPVSYIQSTEWNNTSISKRSDRNICIYIYQWEWPDLSPIHFWGCRKAIQQWTEIDPSEHQLPGYGTIWQTALNSRQVKTYFVRFLKPIYWNWRIYNIHLLTHSMYQMYLICTGSEYVLIVF